MEPIFVWSGDHEGLLTACSHMIEVAQILKGLADEALNEKGERNVQKFLSAHLELQHSCAVFDRETTR